MKKPGLLFSFSPLLLLTLLILLPACGPTPAVPSPTDIPPTPTLAAPTDLPPTELSPTDVHPTDLPPTEVPPTALPQDTPTPTTEDLPALPPRDYLQVAFLNPATDLLLWGEPDATVIPLLPATRAKDVRLSADGTLIAYRVELDIDQQELWAINADGTNARQLLSVDALRALYPDALGTLIHQYAWIPGTHTLAFNTYEFIQAPGQFLNNDLYFLNADTGELSTQLTAGTGGNFVFSPDGLQYALIGFDNDAGVGTISLLNTDGTDLRRNVLTYPYVLTYSEYQYYAQPVWSPDSTFLRVAIPPQDSLGDPTAPTLLWHLTTGGGAFQMGNVVTQPFFIGGTSYAPDLNHLAYTRLPNPDDYLNAELVIAKADGSDEIVYATGNLFFSGWSPDSSHFIYEDSQLQETYLGGLGSNPTLLTDSPYVWNATWLDATRFLFTLQTDAGWEFRLGTVDAGSVLLTDLTDGFAQFDFDH